MLPKQKIIVFDVFAITLIALLAIGVASIGNALALLNPGFSSINPIHRTSIGQPAILPNPQEVELAKLAKIDNFRQELQSVVEEFVASEPNQYGIYIKYLKTDTVASSSPTKSFITASMYKPFAVIESLRMVEDHETSLTAVPNLGGGRTVEQCIWDTITVSDNPCGHALLNISDLSSKTGLAQLQKDGYKNTDMSGVYPVSTAQDIAKLFENIYNQTLLPKDLNNKLLNALKAQKVNDRLPTGSSPDTTLAHKTGDLEGYAHNGGIVYSPRGDYIIVVLSAPDQSGRTLQERYARFGDLMKNVEQIMADHTTDL